MRNLFGIWVAGIPDIQTLSFSLHPVEIPHIFLWCNFDNAGIYHPMNSFDAKFQTTYDICFIFKQTIDRLNVKQHRS